MCGNKQSSRLDDMVHDLNMWHNLKPHTLTQCLRVMGLRENSNYYCDVTGSCAMHWNICSTH